MPFNGSGTFSIVNVFVPNTTILSAAVNQNFSDIATGLSDCLTRDGQAGMTAVFQAVSGSVSAPGISFNSDATAGLYLSSTGIVGLVAKSLGILLNSSIYQVSAAAIQAGGTGYAVGDTITLTGGTAINQAVLTVATLSGSAVATVTVTYPGNYTAKPADPVAQGSSSGIGTGATFNLTWTTQFTRSVVTNESGAAVWSRLGSSSFVSGLMAKANGFDFATAIGASNLASVISGSFIIPPAGVLSPVSSTSTPVPATDQSNVTRIYWTPLNGANVPIYNGTSLVNVLSAQLFVDLTAGAQVLGGIYDVYMFLNAGSPTLGLSPSWSAGTSGSVTAGSCARGSGVGGTALSGTQGIKINAAAMTVNNGATTYSVPANQGTYLGSVYVNAVAGQYNCQIGTGQSRVWGLWNAYNRRPLELRTTDASGSWVNAPTTWRQSRGDATNFAMLFCGLPDEIAECDFKQNLTLSYSNSTTAANIGIGINSTTSPSGTTGLAQATGTSTGSVGGVCRAFFVQPPALGINAINCLEQAPSGTTNNSFGGSSNSMILSVRWRG